METGLNGVEGLGKREEMVSNNGLTNQHLVQEAISGEIQRIVDEDEIAEQNEILISEIVTFCRNLGMFYSVLRPVAIVNGDSNYTGRDGKEVLVTTWSVVVFVGINELLPNGYLAFDCDTKKVWSTHSNHSIDKKLFDDWSSGKVYAEEVAHKNSCINIVDDIGMMNDEAGHSWFPVV